MCNDAITLARVGLSIKTSIQVRIQLRIDSVSSLSLISLYSKYASISMKQQERDKLKYYGYPVIVQSDDSFDDIDDALLVDLDLQDGIVQQQEEEDEFGLVWIG